MKEGNFHLFEHPYFISATFFAASFFLGEISALNWPRDFQTFTSTPQGELLYLVSWVLAVTGALFFAIGLLSHHDEEAPVTPKPRRTVRRKRVA